MQFPESWLRSFCNPPIDTAALADLLTMSGMEVEDARPVAPPFSQVVVGAVLSVARHPNADRLNVCQVDVGQGMPLAIVCGAPNVRPGIKVPCALVGAELPPAEPDGAPFLIRLSELRGVESQGMLCSARELKLSEDHGGLLILDETAPVGMDIRRHLLLDDTLLTLKLTPNLAHALSVHGVARELSALTGAPLCKPACPPVVPSTDRKLPVTIAAPELCGRFSGRVITNVDTRAKTPAWMVERLARCGQRPVTALVDISNYVMFEYGQPTHIFDLDKIGGELQVRWGHAGETLKLLNGNTVAVDAQVGVIADQGGVESLAGIMGGDATAVSDATRNVYVESAFWWPQAVAGRSRRFNFSTEAGHRFERGVDPAATTELLEHITRLILDICGGEAGPVHDQTPNMPQPAPVTLRVARAARVIGMPLTQAQCEGVLDRLGMPFHAEQGGAPGARLVVTPPSWRFDLVCEEDLIEEVIRVIGYDSLPDAPPRAALQARVRSESQRGADAVRRQVAALGYQETINFSFVDARTEHELAGNPDPIRLLNPMASQLSVMRSSLLGGLLNVLRYNLSRKTNRVRVFELGRVFLRESSVVEGDFQVAGVEQPLRLAGLAAGDAQPVQWGVRARPVDFYDVKGDLETLLGAAAVRFVPAEHPALHPGRCASVEQGGRSIGVIGELHPRWRQAHDLPMAPVLFELDLAPLLAARMPRFVPVPRHQSVWRDISVLAPDALTHELLMQTVGAANHGLIRSARLFDVYKPSVAGAGASARSLSVRLEVRDDDATLTDERVDAVVADVLAALEQRLGVRLRA